MHVYILGRNPTNKECHPFYDSHNGYSVVHLFVPLLDLDLGVEMKLDL